MAITALELDALKPKSRPYFFREKQTNKKDGTLAFKVMTNGSKDAYFIYYINGKERQKKIGRYGKSNGQMSLKVIRDKYIDLSKTYQSGIDIKEQEQIEVAEKERERIEQLALERKRQLQGSFRQLLDFYTEHARVNLSKHYYQSIKGAFAWNLKNFDTSIKADQVTSADIRSILNPIKLRASLVMANRMRSYLSAAFEWARDLESDEDDISPSFSEAPAVRFNIETNPVTNVKKALKKEQPVDRFLTEAEVHTFWHALATSSMSIYRKNVLRLMLALGCRVEALAHLQWDEVDFRERLISIPPSRSKNGLYWIIPMNDIAFEILSNTPKQHTKFLFPAENGVEPLRSDGINQATKRLCEKSGIDHFTPRDLRTTFKTLSGKAGLSKDIRDRLQNHALSDVSSKHYDRYDYLTEKQDAMAKWNDYLSRIISGSFTPISNI